MRRVKQQTHNDIVVGKNIFSYSTPKLYENGDVVKEENEIVMIDQAYQKVFHFILYTIPGTTFLLNGDKFVVGLTGMYELNETLILPILEFPNLPEQLIIDYVYEK